MSPDQLHDHLDAASIEAMADALTRSERDRSPVDPLTDQFPEISVADSYAVQRLRRDRRSSDGERVVGAKIGLTSEAMQQQLGVDEPDFGVLFDTMALPNGAELRHDELIAPRVEFEIAFILARAVEGPNPSVDDVLAATDAVFPTLEIIDSRIRDWRLRLPDTVADNASAARFVEASQRTSVEGLDLRLLGGVMEVNGRLVSHGSGAAVLGHPAACVAWLARTLHQYGDRLEAGSVVLSGALGPSVPLHPGDVVVAEIDRLGSTHVTISN